MGREVTSTYHTIKGGEVNPYDRGREYNLLDIAVSEPSQQRKDKEADLEAEVRLVDLSAISALSPVSLLSSNGLRMCVCVCVCACA